MTQYEKLLEKFLKNPCSLGIIKILKILRKNGFEFVSQDGNHHNYKKGKYKITIPIHNEDCKDIYKKKALKIYLKILEEEDE